MLQSLSGFFAKVKKHGLFFSVLIAMVLFYFTCDWMNYPIDQANRWLAGILNMPDRVKPLLAVFVAVFLVWLLAYFATFLLRRIGHSLTHHWKKNSKLSIVTNVMTIGLVLFIWSVPSLEHWLGTGPVSAFRSWLWLALLSYLSVQQYETATRDAANSGKFMIDNGLSLLAFIFAIVIFVLSAVSPPWRMTADEKMLMLQCLAFSSVEFVFGVLFAMRIASAGKERVETERAST